MRIADLDSKELLEHDLPDGVVRFAGERVILVDATAMGVLRRQLHEQFGPTATFALLTRFGYVQGWRLAEALKAQFAWPSGEDWRQAGVRGFMLEGMFGVEIGGPGPLSKEGATIVGSFEAQQHVAHLGRSDSPTCWMICGLLSGYLSRASDQDVFVLEERCVGRGDAVCHFLGRTPAAVLANCSGRRRSSSRLPWPSA